jgi:hypothetical protein
MVSEFSRYSMWHMMRVENRPFAYFGTFHTKLKTSLSKSRALSGSNYGVQGSWEGENMLPHGIDGSALII